MHEVRHSHADHIKGEHGQGEEAHRNWAGIRADHRGNNKDDQDGIADMFEQKFSVHDAEQRKEEDHDGELEGDTQTENDGKKKAGVLFDRDDRMEIFAEVADENLESAGEDPAITEPCAGEEEAEGG